MVATSERTCLSGLVGGFTKQGLVSCKKQRRAGIKEGTHLASDAVLVARVRQLRGLIEYSRNHLGLQALLKSISISAVAIVARAPDSLSLGRRFVEACGRSRRSSGGDGGDGSNIGGWEFVGDQGRPGG